MSKWVVDIHGDIEGDYEIIKKYEEQNTDAISRRAVIEYIEGSGAELGHSSENELVCQYFKELPPVNPQQGTGKWVDNKCSECGKGIEDLISSSEWYENEKPKYCPFCGKKFKEIKI